MPQAVAGAAPGAGRRFPAGIARALDIPVPVSHHGARLRLTRSNGRDVSRSHVLRHQPQPWSIPLPIGCQAASVRLPRMDPGHGSALASLGGPAVSPASRVGSAGSAGHPSGHRWLPAAHSAAVLAAAAAWVRGRRWVAQRAVPAHPPPRKSRTGTPPRHGRCRSPAALAPADGTLRTAWRAGG